MQNEIKSRSKRGDKKQASKAFWYRLRKYLMMY